MINVSNDFKDVAKGGLRDWYGYVQHGATQHLDNCVAAEIKWKSDMLKTFMRRAEIVLSGEVTLIDEVISLHIGVKLPSGSIEYIDYGSFRVTKQSFDKAANETLLIAHDLMYESLLQYDIDPVYDLVFPATTLELVQAICTKLGWTLGSTVFPNSTVSMTSDPLSGLGMSYRDALDRIAEATASTIFFNTDDELILKQIPTATSEALTTGEVIEFEQEAEFGPIDSVVLARTPQEDNITQNDGSPTVEFRVENNEIMDADRSLWIGAIYTELSGFTMTPATVNTGGLGYFEPMDKITVEDKESNVYTVYLTECTINLQGGLSEVIKSSVPEVGETDYDYAGITGRKIKNVEIRVNKQDGEIVLINSNLDQNYLNTAEITILTDSINSSVSSTLEVAQSALDATEANSEGIDTITTNITNLEQTADALEIQVQGIGGSNLLQNSSGLLDDLSVWQERDENGDLLDADNTGIIDTTTDVEENTEAGAAISIEEGFIIQSVPTIVGETYEFYCRFKRSEDAELTISGVADPIPLTVSGYTEGEWAIFKYSFTASNAITSVKVENSATGAYCKLADMVLKLGSVTGWVQYPNEVYGRNYRFDKDGFEVTSPNNNFKAVLDESKLAVYDTSGGTDRTMMQVAKDAGLITNLIVQLGLTVQKEGDASESMRLIPVDGGVMLVIND